MGKEKVTYPEHEKMAAVKDHSQAIGEFLEWLSSERELYICQNGIMDEAPVYWTDDAVLLKYGDDRKTWMDAAKQEGVLDEKVTSFFHARDELRFKVHHYEPYERSGFYPAGIRIEDLLAEYFDIDLKKIDLEKQAMLDAIRQQQYGDPSEAPLGV